MAAFMIGVTFIGVQVSQLAAARAAVVLKLSTLYVTLFLQVAAYTGVINVNWKKVEKEAITLLDQDGDSKLDKKDLLILWGKFKKILLYQLPSSGEWGGQGGLQKCFHKDATDHLAPLLCSCQVASWPVSALASTRGEAPLSRHGPFWSLGHFSGWRRRLPPSRVLYSDVSVGARCCPNEM